MSTGTDQTTTDTDAQLADEYDTIIVAPHTANDNIVHIPKTDVPDDDPRPICYTTRNVDRAWREVPLTTRPEAWRTWCKRCRHVVEHGQEPAGEGR